MRAPLRLVLTIFALQLAACGTATLSSTFNARARINTMPTEIAPTLVMTVYYETFTGTVQPGPLAGQSVTVRSVAGSTLLCTFSHDNWKIAGFGPCRDPQGRQYDMVLDSTPTNFR